MVNNPEKLLIKSGIQFVDKSLLIKSLTHRSAGAKNNERLEFLGDAILGFVIAEILYQRFPNSDEGILSRLRASLVNQQSLASIARNMNLGDFIILGPGELKSGGFRRDSILSDALEALMGGLLKDQGFARCKEWILHIFAPQLDGLSLDNWEKDPKTRLQETLQGAKKALPVYKLRSQTGLPHDQIFVVNCIVEGVDKMLVGKGGSRKKAEQEAAEKMLHYLQTEQANQ